MNKPRTNQSQSVQVKSIKAQLSVQHLQKAKQLVVIIIITIFHKDCTVTIWMSASVLLSGDLQRHRKPLKKCSSLSLSKWQKLQRFSPRSGWGSMRRRPACPRHRWASLWSSVVAGFAVWLSGIGRLLGYLHLAILRGLVFDLGRLEGLEDGLILLTISR